MDLSAEFWINHLKLIKHPEGGNYRECYRSELEFVLSGSENSFKVRRAGTSIYFLLRAGEFSAFHKIAFDELWHFYSGAPLEVFEIESNTGNLSRYILGPDPRLGEEFQIVIKGGNWFASKSFGPLYSLVGCTVSPGFEFSDFQLADRNTLLELYPQHTEHIIGLTR